MHAIMRKNRTKDLEPLLELQRKTKAGEVSPLVSVELKNFRFWPGKAYWAYCHRKKIAREQLKLRRKLGLESDERAASVVGLCRQLHDEALWMECGDLFPQLMAEDSWSMVAALMDEDAVDGFGIVDFLEAVECRYGKLTDEEMDSVLKIETVGQLAAFLDQVVAEGRKKAQPRKRRRWLDYCGWLVTALFGLTLIWIIFKLLHWLALRVLG
jgi:hypothetical protein